GRDRERYLLGPAHGVERLLAAAERPSPERPEEAAAEAVEGRLAGRLVGALAVNRLDDVHHLGGDRVLQWADEERLDDRLGVAGAGVDHRLEHVLDGDRVRRVGADEERVARLLGDDANSRLLGRRALLPAPAAERPAAANPEWGELERVLIAVLLLRRVEPL